MSKSTNDVSMSKLTSLKDAINYAPNQMGCSLLVVEHVKLNRYLEKIREERLVNGGVSRRMPENHCETT